jgi:predicted transcriptional regulator
MWKTPACLLKINNMKTLREILKEKEIGPIAFTRLCGIPKTTLDRFFDNPKHNLCVRTAKKIYKATEKSWGEGLDVWEYIDRNIIN